MRMATQPSGGGSAAWGDLIAQRARGVADSVARTIAYPAVTPNLLTVVGFLLTCGVALLIGAGWEAIGGVLVILVGLFDMLDGAMARVSARKTSFGGFLDSTLDRVSDMAAFVGLMLFYARDTEFHSTLNVLLAGLAMVGSVLVSYASARAESLIPKCDVGFLRRPERVVLLIIGALSTHPSSDSIFANRMPAVLWILAVGSFWTFAYRVYHTWSELNRIAATEPASATSAPTQPPTPTRPDAPPPTTERAQGAGDEQRRDAPKVAQLPASR